MKLSIVGSRSLSSHVLFRELREKNRIYPETRNYKVAQRINGAGSDEVSEPVRYKSPVSLEIGLWAKIVVAKK